MIDIRIKIDPVEADAVCRKALLELAVVKGLDKNWNYSVENWHWHNKGTHPNMTFQDGVVFCGRALNG